MIELSKEELVEIIESAFNRQKEDYFQMLKDNLQHPSPSSLIGSIADEIAFEIKYLIKEKETI